MDPAHTAQVWDLPSPEQIQTAISLAAELGLPMTAAQVLVRRGLADTAAASAFLSVGATDLLDPFLLEGLRDAADRLVRAIRDEERIVVHGDYDADGICGTALLVRGLRRLGALVEAFVPDRQRDGYGVASRLVEHAGQREVALLITVDTGSSASEEFCRARELGIDVIVCDHHRFDSPPEGVGWFLNPLREDSGYPHGGLCGAGVAQKLLAGLHAILGKEEHPGLDLAAIATVADQVPLNRENRAIVRLGLDRLGQTLEPGLRALLEICKLQSRRIDAEDIAFQIAPRINAAGRIARARTALDLLLCTSRPEASRGAHALDDLNRQRRELDRIVTADALEKAAELVRESDPAGLVLSSPEWHRGVVGISASKVVERFGRPALLLAEEGELAVGSARSVPGVDLKRALDGCASLLQRYGGHAAAAGATLDSSRIPELRDAFAAAVELAATSPVQAPLYVDAMLDPTELGPDLASFLYDLGPFGMGNRAPRMAGVDLAQSVPPRPVGDRHLRLGFSDGNSELSVIGFGRAPEWLPIAAASPRLDVSFGLRHRPGSRWSEWECIGHEIRATDPAHEEKV